MEKIKVYTYKGNGFILVLTDDPQDKDYQTEVIFDNDIMFAPKFDLAKFEKEYAMANQILFDEAGGTSVDFEVYENEYLFNESGEDDA